MADADIKRATRFDAAPISSRCLMARLMRLPPPRSFVMPAQVLLDRALIFRRAAPLATELRARSCAIASAAK